MDNQFFERPILNSPYDYPTRYWELDVQGQPTQRSLRSAYHFAAPAKRCPHEWGHGTLRACATASTHAKFSGRTPRL
jgi:hypothetical protein